jgi:hypothetical protein
VDSSSPVVPVNVIGNRNRQAVPPELSIARIE